jgi:hypothetical protein
MDVNDIASREFECRDVMLGKAGGSNDVGECVSQQRLPVQGRFGHAEVGQTICHRDQRQWIVNEGHACRVTTLRLTLWSRTD